MASTVMAASETSRNSQWVLQGAFTQEVESTALLACSGSDVPCSLLHLGLTVRAIFCSGYDDSGDGITSYEFISEGTSYKVGPC